MKEAVGVKKRNANIEFLRLLSMLLVVFLHGLDKGENLLQSDSMANTTAAWLIECLSIVAVNAFMLISGYFMSTAKFKVQRLIGLVMQTVFYSLGAFLVCGAVGIIDMGIATTHDKLLYIFPLHMGTYWFVAAYVVMYLFSPILNRAVEYVTKKQLGMVIVLLLIYESAFKTILPLRLEDDDMGYSALWFLTMYLIGAYFRKFGFKVINTTLKGFLTYIVSVLVVLAETAVLHYFQLTAGHFSEITRVSLEYNHLINILAAVGLFSMFVHMTERENAFSKVIVKLSPLALGVYLLHESPVLRFEWPKWVGIYDIKNLPLGLFVGKLVLGVLAVFVAGLAVDEVRTLIFKLFGVIVSKTKLPVLFEKINESVNGINNGKQSD